ncbi:hypothetical protein GCM10022394_22650 [Zobellella aerophila]|uniref:Uncharacterized protein n=1 Tax=Zobellella aerophila TaxID=870480 RepID=A0ABP6VXI0_9GAMM
MEISWLGWACAASGTVPMINETISRGFIIRQIRCIIIILLEVVMDGMGTP